MFVPSVKMFVLQKTPGKMCAGKPQTGKIYVKHLHMTEDFESRIWELLEDSIIRWQRIFKIIGKILNKHFIKHMKKVFNINNHQEIYIETTMRILYTH